MTARFDQRFLDDVRARTGLVDLISREIPLKRRGRGHWGLCPFHAEKTPSFAVNEERGFVRCFGCGWHGDAIDWVRDRHGMSFPEAVEDLAIRAGLRPDREGRSRPKARPVARPSRTDRDRERDGRIAWARTVWSAYRPALATAIDKALAFHAARGRRVRIARPPEGTDFNDMLRGAGV